MYSLEKKDSRRYRSGFLNPLEAPVSLTKNFNKKQNYSLENCISKMDNVMNVTNLMKKLTEELMRRTAFSLFKNIFSAIEGFDEKLQRIQIAVDEYSGSSKGKTTNMLKSQRSNYAKLANELLMQSNI